MIVKDLVLGMHGAEATPLRADRWEQREAAESIPGDFSSLYEKFSKAIFAFLFSRTGEMELARDLLQETFLRAFRAIDRYDRAKGSYSWLRQIALNEVRRHFSREGAFKRPREVSMSGAAENRGRPGEVLDFADRRADPEAALADQELTVAIRSALSSLPPDSRALVIQYHMHNKSRGELAAVYGISEATIMRRVQRARAELRRSLSSMGIAEPPAKGIGVDRGAWELTPALSE